MEKLTENQYRLIEQMKIYTAVKNETFGWYHFRGSNINILSATMNGLIRKCFAQVNDDNTVTLTDKAQQICN